MFASLNPWQPPNGGLARAGWGLRLAQDYTFGARGTIKTTAELLSSFWTMLNFNPPIFEANGVESGYRSEGDLQTYDAGTLTVSTDCMLITAMKDLKSGLVRTKRPFRYGFVEAEIWMPRGAGLIPQFWLYTNDPLYGGGNDCEIDIVEHVNNPARQVDGRLLWANCKGPGAGAPLFDLRTGTQFNANNYPVGSLLYHTEFDRTDGYHKYGCWWVPGYVVMYLDDVPFVVFSHPWKTTWGWVAPPAGITLNFAIGISGDNFAGTLDPSGKDLPAVLKCRHIRVWQ